MNIKTLRINVENKIATFRSRDGVIVCGNKGYALAFTFDEEWDGYTTKTARFIWNGKYSDQQFTGDECPVPVLNDTTNVTVGVYAGDLKTTTPAEIPCLISILCGEPEVIEGNIKEYRDIAQQAAAEAQEAAEEAKTAAESVVHPTIDVEEIEGGHRLTINDVGGKKTFDVMDGEGSGEQGIDGEDGATFTPSVSSDGVLSWTNNKGLPNPDPINIKGADGKDGEPGADGKDGANGQDGQDGAPGADGEDGKTPYIQEGYWFINGESTHVRAEGVDGKDGEDGSDGVDGEDGIGISKAEINADGELVLTYTDGNIVNLGKVVGEDGDDAEGGGLTPEQLVQFNELVDWYNESTYTTMTASISPSTSTYEIGSKKTITFTWTFKVGTKTAELSSLTFRGASVSVTQTSATVENISSTSSYTVSGTRKDGKKESKSATASVNFYNKYYFGCDVDPQISPTSATKDQEYSDFIKGSNGWNGLKLKSDWANSRKTFTYTPNCPDGSYIWYAYPTRLGASTFKMNGLPAEFSVQVVAFTNSTGKYTEDYYLYRSIEPSLGSIEIQVL